MRLITERLERPIAWVKWFDAQTDAEKVTRKLAKIATMSNPYGAKPGGVAKQIVGSRLVPGDEDQYYANANYIADRLFRCFPSVIPSAIEVMNWLQHDIAKPLAAANKGISWITASGFPVIHEYRRLKQKQTRLGDGRRHTFPDDESHGGQLMEDKQVDAIVANLVHSLDAAHMTLTVTELRSRGVRDFAMIHDSYAVHASKVGAMQRVLRQIFVKVHRENVLWSLWKRQRRQHGVNLKPPPISGRLDVRSVCQSPYFFS